MLMKDLKKEIFLKKSISHISTIKKKKLLLKCDLAINDLTLYLDIHENDESALNQLTHYKKELNKARNTYLEKYGPIMPCQVTSTFKWNDEPFPWED